MQISVQSIRKDSCQPFGDSVHVFGGYIQRVDGREPLGRGFGYSFPDDGSGIYNGGNPDGSDRYA